MNTFDELPDKIKVHLKAITASSGLPDSEESLDIIFGNWLEKKKLFEDQIRTLGMVEGESFSMTDKRGALLLTYSGSLISLGIEEERWMEYASIKLRGDVPDILKSESVKLAGNVKIDSPAEFIGGPLKKSSEIFKIAYCASDVNLQEQDKRIKEATIFLTNGFIKINRTLAIHKEDSGYHQFDMKSMVSYIAKRNGITQVQVSKILDEYLAVVETGLLLGERVSFGRLGHLSLKMRAAQKARVGRNPQTGEEMTIPAKPKIAIPKVSFSKYLKDRAAQVDTEFLEQEEEGE